MRLCLCVKGAGEMEVEGHLEESFSIARVSALGSVDDEERSDFLNRNGALSRRPPPLLSHLDYRSHFRRSIAPRPARNRSTSGSRRATKPSSTSPPIARACGRPHELASAHRRARRLVNAGARLVRGARRVSTCAPKKPKKPEPLSLDTERTPSRHAPSHAHGAGSRSRGRSRGRSERLGEASRAKALNAFVWRGAGGRRGRGRAQAHVHPSLLARGPARGVDEVRDTRSMSAAELGQEGRGLTDY